MFERSGSCLRESDERNRGGVYTSNVTPSRTIPKALHEYSFTDPTPDQLKLYLSQSRTSTIADAIATQSAFTFTNPKMLTRATLKPAELISYINTTKINALVCDKSNKTASRSALIKDYTYKYSNKKHKPVKPPSYSGVNIRDSHSQTKVTNTQNTQNNAQFGSLPQVNSDFERSRSVMDQSPPIKRRCATVKSTTRMSLPENQKMRKLVKVYLSNKQSSNITECGMMMPCAPPATPTPEVLSKYQYVPSMTDIKSQNLMKVRLKTLSQIDERLEEARKRDRLKEEETQIRLAETLRKQRQRLEIYALNRVMTEYENANFIKFMKQKDYEIPPDTSNDMLE